ncbi:MAG: hypothetical protein ACOYD4_12025 [Solirubrobacterales bacterium]
MARPSLCFVLVLALAFLVGAITAPAGRAIPPAPALTATSPASPGASLSPRIQGRADGVIISVISRGAGIGPIPSSIDPNDTITLYEGDPTCLDPTAVAAVSTAGELEGVGIPVTVAQDTTTTFYATQANETGTSACSAEGITYRQVTTPPAKPTFAGVTPASPANDNAPRLTGTADPQATVSIYANAGCTGAVLGAGSGAQFAASGIPAAVADNTTTTFHASASLGGIGSGCSSSSIVYQEVTPPPAPGGAPTGVGGGSVAGPLSPPVLHTVPGGRANDNAPLVVGRAPGAASVAIFTNARCGGNPVARGSAAELGAGLGAQVPDNTTVGFYGLAFAGGTVSACSPTPAVYVEDSTPPQTRITLGPAAKTRKRTTVFRFADVSEDPPGTTFLCKVDRAKWRACRSPFHLRRLSRKSHLVRVKAVDVAGNQEQGGAKRRFKVVPGL